MSKYQFKYYYHYYKEDDDFSEEFPDDNDKAYPGDYQVWLEKDGEKIWEWWMEDLEWHNDQINQIKDIKQDLEQLGLYVIINDLDDYFDKWVAKEIDRESK